MRYILLARNFWLFHYEKIEFCHSRHIRQIRYGAHFLLGCLFDKTVSCSPLQKKRAFFVENFAVSKTIPIFAVPNIFLGR